MTAGWVFGTLAILGVVCLFLLMAVLLYGALFGWWRFK